MTPQIGPRPRAITFDRTLRTLRIRAVLLFLIAANVFDMGGVVGVKYVSYACALLFALPELFHVRAPRGELLAVWLLFAVWPTYALARGIYAGADIGLAVSQSTAFAAALLFYFLLSGNRSMWALRVLFATLLALAVFSMAFMLLGLTLPGNGIFNAIMGYFSSDPGHGYFGMRMMGPALIPNVYFRATLFYVPAAVYYLITGRVWRALALAFALLVCLSKAGLLITLAFFAVYLLLQRRAGIVQKALVLAAVAAGAVALAQVSPTYLNLIFSSATGESETVALRVRHLGSVVDLFADNPEYLILGAGAGTEFYSEGEGGWVANIEVDHLNAARKFGLPWLLVFTALVFTAAWRLFRSGDSEKRAVAAAVTASFLAAGTNPVLLSPVSLMIIMAALRASGVADDA